MNTKTIMLAAIIMSAVLVVVVAMTPALSNNSFAKKTCTVGQSSTSCNENNIQTPAAHCKAGNSPNNSPNCNGAKV
jgi:hypothetical protein